uniref:Putative secreted protein n=1 Tax=Anopheles darlingi TaxID=43151 RepID=A0A2M4D5D7_ANODA
MALHVIFIFLILTSPAHTHTNTPPPPSQKQLGKFTPAGNTFDSARRQDERPRNPRHESGSGRWFSLPLRIFPQPPPFVGTADSQNASTSQVLSSLMV